MADKNIFETIKLSGTFPQLPQTMLRLIKACNSEKTSIEELTGIISMDPSLTSRLLQILGSPYIHLPKEVNSIKTAVVYLGLDTLRNMAISTSAMHFFKMSRQIPEFDLPRFWRHSYSCAVLGRELARETGLVNPDELFLAGLLHDIGRLVLIQNFPDDYRTILQTAAGEKQILDSEIRLFDADTPQVSAWLFTQWQLNPLTADAVLFINERPEQIRTALPHVRLLFAANRMAGSETGDDLPDLTGITDIPMDQLRLMARSATEEVLNLSASMGIRLDGSPDPACEEAVTSEIKDLSLCYGTLQNLLRAKDVETALDITRNGFKIIFNIPRMFYFLVDEQKAILTGFCNRRDRAHRIIKSIALPLSNHTSRLTACCNEQKIQNSLKPDPSRTEQAVSDLQIIRLLGTKGMYCVPIPSPGGTLGVMVLGVDPSTAGDLDGSQSLVRLISGQTGNCIRNLQFHADHSLRIHEKKMEAYALMTDKVIHEINNPISIIRNYIETLGLKLPDKHPAQSELTLIGEEMIRVSALLDKLRGFSTPRIGGFEPVDVNRICTSLLEVLRKSILIPRRIETEADIDPDLPSIKTDPDGLKQVLINLVKNAAEAMPDGGKITVSTRFRPESAKIMIDEKKRIPGHIEIMVTDNGPGIDDDLKETLFDPYVTTKTDASHSGLGLSIVHSIIKELNGRIQCLSEKGRGTRFTITLPVQSSRKE